MSNDPFAHRPEEQPQNTSFEQAYGQPYGQSYGQPYGQSYEQNGYGYGPPPGYQPQPGVGPLGVPYASWGTRVGARLVDSLFSFLPLIVLGIAGAVVVSSTSHTVTQPDGTTTTSDPNLGGVALIVAGVALLFLFDFWNRGIRQGKGGHSIGKKWLGLSVVDENTGRPTGAGMGAARWGIEWVMHAASSCVGFVGPLDVLWPLWDAKNQTLHDKVVHTVVVTEPDRI